MDMFTRSAGTLGQRDVTEAETETRLKRIVGASVIGTALEWYDFYLYGFASALIFGPMFFPGLGTLGGTLASFATFAVGYVVRPLGGIYFGVLGDRLGRRKVLIITLLLMGGATTCIGLVPDAAAIGWLAPVLLVLLRVIQGLGAGAEFGGAVLMCAETAPKRSRGFFSSLPQVGVALGGLAASGAFVLVAQLTSGEAFASWGWRIPFLLSIVAVLVGLFIRLRVVETPVFEKLKSERHEAEHPLKEVLRTHRRSLLVAVGARFADNGVVYVYQTVVLAYGVQYLHKSKSLFLTALAIESAFAIATVPAFGALSDRIGRRTVYLAGAVFSALFVFPFFFILESGPDWMILVAVLLALGIGREMMSAAQAPYFAELFDARVRYTGFATAREGTAIIGGFLPMIGSALIIAGGGAWWPVATLLTGMTLVTVIALCFGPETKDRDMDVDMFSPRPAGYEPAAPRIGEPARSNPSYILKSESAEP
jgi:MFS transporter, MHS family, shikimate and dehydroshikimate transport protein